MTTLPYGGHAPAGHKTLETGMRLDVASFIQGIGADFFPILIYAFRPVTRRKCTGGIYQLHHHGRSQRFIGFRCRAVFGFRRQIL